jgi:hypothetical protein
MLKDFVPLQVGVFGYAICLQVINVFVRTESS